jgi:hypothetical protein
MDKFLARQIKIPISSYPFPSRRPPGGARGNQKSRRQGLPVQTSPAAAVAALLRGGGGPPAAKGWRGIRGSRGGGLSRGGVGSWVWVCRVGGLGSRWWWWLLAGGCGVMARAKAELGAEMRAASPLGASAQICCGWSADCQMRPLAGVRGPGRWPGLWRPSSLMILQRWPLEVSKEGGRRRIWCSLPGSASVCFWQAW